MSGHYAWVTLATNDAYALGTLVLASSLRRFGTQYEMAVLVTPGVSYEMNSKLKGTFNLVQEVNILESHDRANLRLLRRPELGVTFTKLHCWRLKQYDKCVFLDADTMVLDNVDELFEKEEFSAAPDVGWPDCFNSGVFVYRPSEETYNRLVDFALHTGSFDGADQGLLNLYFSNWAHADINKHLPFIYNMCSTGCYSYLPAFIRFGGRAKIVHFIGTTKPWLLYFNPETRQVHVPNEEAHLAPILQTWWDIFCADVHPCLRSHMHGLAGALARVELDKKRNPEQVMLDEYLRRQCWELGNVDYMGHDSFTNIWQRICQSLEQIPNEPVFPPIPAPNDPDPLPYSGPNSDDDDDEHFGRTSPPDAESKRTETSPGNKLVLTKTDIPPNSDASKIISPAANIPYDPTGSVKIPTEDSCPKLLSSVTPVTSLEMEKEESCQTSDHLTDSAFKSKLELEHPNSVKSKTTILESSVTSENTEISIKSDREELDSTIETNKSSPSVTETSTERSSATQVSAASHKDQQSPLESSEGLSEAVRKSAETTIPEFTSTQEAVLTSNSSSSTLCDKAAPSLTQEIIPELTNEIVPSVAKETVPSIAKDTVLPSVSKEILLPLSIRETDPQTSANLEKPTGAKTTNTQSAQAPVAPPRKNNSIGADKKKSGKGKSK